MFDDQIRQIGKFYFYRPLDFTGLEQVITARLNELGAELVKQVVEPLLIDAGLCRAVEGPGRAAGAEVQGVSVGAGPLRYGTVDYGQDGLFP